MTAASHPQQEPPVTGVSAAGANGDVALMIPPADAAPTRILKKGPRIWIASPDRILSDEVYGPHASSLIDVRRNALVVEVVDGGEVRRITRLALED